MSHPNNPKTVKMLTKFFNIDLTYFDFNSLPSVVCVSCVIVLEGFVSSCKTGGVSAKVFRLALKVQNQT